MLSKSTRLLYGSTASCRSIQCCMCDHPVIVLWWDSTVQCMNADAVCIECDTIIHIKSIYIQFDEDEQEIYAIFDTTFFFFFKYLYQLKG